MSMIEEDSQVEEIVVQEEKEIIYSRDEEAPKDTPLCYKKCEMASCENEARWLCENCPLSLCDRCKDQHLKTQIWQNHKTVPIHEGGPNIINKCRIHQSETISNFCVTCDHTVCKMCIPDHSGHSFLSLHEAELKKKSELDKFNHNLQTRIEPSFEATKTLLKIKQNDLEDKLKLLHKEIETQIEKIIHAIFKISDEMKNSVTRFQNDYKQEMLSIEGAIDQGCQKISNVKIRCAELQNAHIDAISDFLREKADFETTNPPSIPVIRPPTFLSGMIKSSQLQRQIGCLILPDHLCEFPTTFPPHNILDDITSKCIVLGNRNTKHLQVLKFNGTSFRGKDEVKTDVRTEGLVKADDGMLLVSDRDNHCILRVKKNGKCEKLIDTGWLHPRGILINNLNEIVVCLSGMTGKISIYSSDGKCKKRDLDKDNSDAPIAYNPQQIVQNYNGDYVIIDRNINQFLIVAIHVDASGSRKRWTFQGGQNVKSADFHPEGLVCDKMWNILISDHAHDEVIILSRDGEYLDCLLTSENGISKPLGLTIDSLGKLWVGQNDKDKGKLSIYKYLMDN